MKIPPRRSLQTVLGTVYERSAYDLRIDYRAEPAVAFTPAQAARAVQLLRSCGKR
jgi:hypothetical protein